MKLVSFEKDQRSSYGILIEDGIIDLGRRIGDEYPDLKSAVGAGLDKIRGFEDTAEVDFKLSEVILAPPIPNPGAIWIIGLNTHSHFEEVKDLLKMETLPEYPTTILRASNTLVASGQALEKPAKEHSFDYEGEIAVIIGAPCRNVSVEEAMDYVLGYSCFNDASARHYQMTSAQMTAGKNAYRSGGFGPHIVTSDSVDVDALELTTRLNGEECQHMKMDDLVFSFAELISFISEFNYLQPGDVIVTGSPSGVGTLREPPRLLKAGDEVEVEVKGIGTLFNSVHEHTL